MSYHRTDAPALIHKPEPRKLTLTRELLRHNFVRIPGADIVIDSSGPTMWPPDTRSDD